MNSSFIFCLFVLVACLFHQGLVSADCPPLHGSNVGKTGQKVIDKCAEYTCHEDGSWTSLGCGTYQCHDEIGWRDTDLSKPYPECCAGPICKSEINKN